MNSYKVLNQQVFSNGEYSIVPIRMEDRYHIMQWRNEQMYHLRQNQPLTKEAQDEYFQNVIAKLFDQEKPQQILFSYLQGDKCIGYGGLVHINWVDKNAEVSFLTDSNFEIAEVQFHLDNFLPLIETVAKIQLRLHKVYTYAYDIRPFIYVTLENNNYFKEATLIQHCYFEGKFINVVIHSNIFTEAYETL